MFWIGLHFLLIRLFASKRIICLVFLLVQLSSDVGN
uniref:Uncharacterized protein n=1 Tax=Rhizophora mucronata TaxID=61149 RepID=A0A2P2IVU6_RHIMU